MTVSFYDRTGIETFFFSKMEFKINPKMTILEPFFITSWYKKCKMSRIEFAVIAANYSN